MKHRAQPVADLTNCTSRVNNPLHYRDHYTIGTLIQHRIEACTDKKSAKVNGLRTRDNGAALTNRLKNKGGQ
jgi:hypothetical protein